MLGRLNPIIFIRQCNYARDGQLGKYFFLSPLWLTPERVHSFDWPNRGVEVNYLQFRTLILP